MPILYILKYVNKHSIDQNIIKLSITKTESASKIRIEDKEVEINKWSFDYLPPTIWSWNFSVNPLISSLERDVLLWWGREGCCGRRGEEGNKKKERGIEKEEKELLDFRCSQENNKSEKTFAPHSSCTLYLCIKRLKFGVVLLLNDNSQHAGLGLLVCLG